MHLVALCQMSLPGCILVKAYRTLQRRVLHWFSLDNICISLLEVHNEIPQIEWLMHLKFIFSLFLREVHVQGVRGLVSSQACLLSLVSSQACLLGFLLPLSSHGLSSVCVCAYPVYLSLSKFLLLISTSGSLNYSPP